LPIYHHSRPASTLEEGRTNLHGFVLLVLHMDNATETALVGRNSAGLTLTVGDEAAPLGTGIPLYGEALCARRHPPLGRHIADGRPLPAT
jgi:hypothetical protein